MSSELTRTQNRNSQELRSLQDEHRQQKKLLIEQNEDELHQLKSAYQKEKENIIKSGEAAIVHIKKDSSQNINQIKEDASLKIEGNPGFTYLQEIKIRNKTTSKIKVFQLLGLQSNWFHKANDSANYTESLEIETGLEWYPTKGIWLQASARQNIDEKPYFSNFKLYKEDQLEYHLRLFVQL